MHHFASFNNQFYRKAIEYMQDTVGTQPSKWCAGCHDHAVFFNGRFERPIKEQIDTPEAKAGLACTSCHAITSIDSSMGNGGFTIEYPPLHELMSSRNPVIRRLDRFMTYLNPEPHRRTFMKPFMRTDAAEYCAACHKVHLDVPVNDYRWIRGFNDYDNWQASGVSGQGARSFYYPAQSSTCVDCHMNPVQSNDPGRHEDGTVHSHRFAAANTAVPFINKDTTQLKEVEDFLKSGFITMDIFSVAPIDEKAAGVRIMRRAGEGPQALSASGAGEEAESRDRSSFAKSARWRRQSTRRHLRWRPGRPRASTWWCARGASATSFQAGPSTPSTSGSSCKARTPMVASCTGAAGWPRTATGQSTKALISTSRSSSMARATPSTSGTPGRLAACSTCGTFLRARPIRCTIGFAFPRTRAGRSR